MSDEQALVLVVDDNEMNRDMLSRRLERQGYRAIVAEDGQQALEMLPQHPVDLVLLDIMMPRMNGYEVLERAKSDPALRHIPIIMISAVDDLDSVVKCVEMGADDYLFKPFNPILLKARISASLEKKRLQEQMFSERAGSDGLGGLPDFAAERLRAGKGTVADYFAEATVLCAGVIGLERVSDGFTPGEMVDLLNSLFSEFDSIVVQHGVFRVKTIGSAYVAAGGVPHPAQNHAHIVAAAALDMMNAIARWKAQSGGLLGLQIGIHTGAAVGGIIRAGSSLSYDLWGDAVSLASAAQAASPVDAITLTESAAYALGDAFVMEAGGEITFQGYAVPIYFLTASR